MTIVYRTNGAWGVGKESNLTAAEGDGNIWDVVQRLVALETDRPSPNEISQVQQDGLQITFILADGTELGPIDLPTLKWRWRGDWLPNTIYATLDTFTVDDQGLFLVIKDHTSAATFDPDAGIGSPAEAVYHQLLGVGTLTSLDDLVGVTITSPAAGDFLGYDGADWVNRTATAATALLDEFVGDVGSPGGGLKGLVPAPVAGDAAAGKLLRADGQWAGTSDLAAATLPLNLASLIEISEASGSPATYESKKLAISDLLDAGEITLGSTAIALGSTVTTIAGLTLSDATLTGNTTLPDSGQISSAGLVGIGTTPSRRLDIGGTFTTTVNALVRVAGTFASSTTSSQFVLSFAPTIAPTGASLATIFGGNFGPTVNNTALNITNVIGLQSTVALGASYSGVVANHIAFYAADVTISGGSLTNETQFQGDTVARTALASGSSTNIQFLGSGITAGAAGGTVNNRGAQLTVPSGGASSGTANNRGLYITGNGGTPSGSPPGTVNNFAILSDSTAYSRIEGGLGVGVATRNATTATSPYFYIPTCAGTPTGVPRNAAVGATAMVFDDTAHKLWVYEQSTATWKGVVVA